MSIKIFADVGNWTDLENYNNDPDISGFTTNPSLLRKGGVTDYKNFAQKAATLVNPKPISFEVFANTEKEMFDQALALNDLGENIYVKVPITMPIGGTPFECIRWLEKKGVNLNITGIMTALQVIKLVHNFPIGKGSHILSVFAGRIADTGKDPVEMIRFTKLCFFDCPKVKVLWASTRELYNIKQAESCICDIITVTPDILAKRHLLGKDLTQYSKETVKQFHQDAAEAGFTI